MVMSWVFTVLVAVSIICAIISGSGSALAAAAMQGAQAGVELTVGIAGGICLWCGVGKLLERSGITSLLSKLWMPLLRRVFPSAAKDEKLASVLSANVCANFLGLGNAATPMGIQAAKRMVDHKHPDRATDEMCRLIVLNTASIQLIPANVAAIRSNLGSSSPFDILPAVWITSICSAGLGVLAAVVLGKLWKHD